MVRRRAERENATNNETLDDIAAAKAVGDLDLVFLRRPDVLGADHARKLFSGWKGCAIDDGYGDDGLEGGEARDCAEDESVGCGWVRSLSVYGGGVVCEGACETGAELAVLEIHARSDGGRAHGHWLSWEEERHK